MNMKHHLIGLLLLTGVHAPAYVQETEQPVVSATEAITSLSKRIGSMLQDHFTTLETLATNNALVEAIKSDNTSKLGVFAASFQRQLTDSLKVRIYIRGKEQTDLKNTPACGFACIAIVRNSYREDPPAEALLFRSPDANLTLARGIKDADGNTVGSIVAQYPFKLLKQEVEQLNTAGLYTELRQIVKSPVTLYFHGDQTIKIGTAQKIVRIPNSKWVVSVWTPGGISIEEYIAPELPWMYIVLAFIVFIGGIIILMITHKKYRKLKKVEKKTEKYVEPPSAEAISYDKDYDDSPTLIMGGGAREVDVARYLKDTEVTQISKKKND